MNKIILYVLGAVLVLVGLLGFVNDPVFGIFEVDIFHNTIHLLTGAMLLIAGARGGSTGALLVKITAVFYALVAIIGFASSGDTILNLFENNFSDDILHVILAGILIWLGFFPGKEISGGSGEQMDSSSNQPVQSQPTMEQTPANQPNPQNPQV